MTKHDHYLAIVDEIHAHPATREHRALLLTLTQPAQTIDDASIVHLQKSLKRFWAMPDVAAVVTGHLTSIEGKPGKAKDAKGRPMLHWHAHAIACVPPSYFATGLPAVHQTQWERWWRAASRETRKLVLDIRAIRGPDGATDHNAVRRSVREAVKYAISTDTYQHADDGIHVDPLVTLALYRALKSKRLITTGGVFKDAEKRLKRKAMPDFQSGV